MHTNDRLSEEKLLGEEHSRDGGDVLSLQPRRRSRHTICLWGFHLLFTLVNVITILSTFINRNGTMRGDCKDHMPMYSPALEAVRGTGHFHRFDGSFATPNTFKGTPNSDIDAAWADITYENGSCLPLIYDRALADSGRRCHQYL
ncbi:MAG: hypothetical protein Q9204_003516 [Flavoplaca sp. TL-2023a]